MLSLECLKSAAAIYDRIILAKVEGIDHPPTDGSQPDWEGWLTRLAADVQAERVVVMGVIAALSQIEAAFEVVRAEHQRPTAPVCPRAANDHHPTSPEQPGPRIA